MKINVKRGENILKLKNPRLFRKVIHELIVKYLIKCGGAFHCRPYGKNGLYVALMNDTKYHEYTKL